MTWLRAVHSINPATLRKIMNIMSAIFTTAFDDKLVDLHPCKGVKLPPIPKRKKTVITPEQFDTFFSHIPDDMSLLIEADIETGLRWGELTELRPKDWDGRTRTFIIQRAVVEVNPANHDGNRFRVKEYPKDEQPRAVNVSKEFGAKIDYYLAVKELEPDDLLFRFPDDRRSLGQGARTDTMDDLGLTAPNENGRRYRHGTTSAYGAGRCRCEHCRAAVAAYRAQRRAEGKDRPPTGTRDKAVHTDGHIPNSWFRYHIWLPALRASGLDIHFRPQGMRHAHASWLVAGGASIEVVMTRLGHAKLATTQRYVHALDKTDETALAALESVRKRTKVDAAPLATEPNTAPTPEQLLKLMQEHQAAVGSLQAQLTSLLSSEPS